MFLKEVSLFLDDAPLEEGDLATELPPIASGAMLTRCEGFAVVWRLLNGNKTLELRLVAVGHVSNTAEDMDMSDIATDYGALVDEVSRRLPVRFNFVAPIVPDVHFFEKEEAGIFIFCTQDGVVHEFRFPHELLFYSDLSDPSAWSKEHVLVSMKKESRSRHAVGFHALRSSMWVVACNDGALIHVDGENFQEHEMFPDSRKPLTRSLTTSLLWFGLGRGGESSQDNSNTQTTATTQVVSMASVICEPQQAQYLLTVSRDWKLRVWSLVDHRCVHVVSLDSNHRSNLDPTSPKYVAEVMSRRVRRLLRVFDCNLDDRGDSSQGYSFKAAIYCPFDESDVFVVYEAHLDSEGAWQKLDKVASINTPPSASAAQSVGEAQAVLADFDITPDSFAYPESSNEDGGGEETTGLTESGFWTVWTLWTREREMDLCYCKFGDEGRPSLHGVVGTSDMMSTIANIGDWTRILKTGTSWLESPDFNATEIGPRSVSEVFLQHIFYPNRFSPAAIVQALRTAERSGIIERSAGVSRAVMESMRSSEFPAGQLKNMLATAFETEGDDMSIPGGGTARDISDKAELCKLRWIKFLNACIQNQLLLNSPISLIIDSRYLHTIFVIKLGALATLRFCEELDILDQVYTGELEEPGDQDGTFSFLSQFPLSSYRDVLTPRTWDVFMVYLDALEILYNGIPAAVFSAVEEDVIVALRNMDSLPLASFVSNLVSRHGIGSAPTQVLGQLASGFLSKLSSCNNLQAFFGKMLSLLRDSSDFGVLGRRDSHEGASSSTSRPTTLSFQYTILALQQIAESRHRTCWNLAITLIMVSSLDQQEVVLPRSEVSALLADCLEVLRVWVILRWLCRETANAGSQPRSWNSALNRKHDLPGTLWNTDTDDDADATVSTKYQTLIATIMSQSKHGLPAHVLSDEAPLASYLLSWTWHFLAGEGFCQSPNGLYEANDGYALSVRKAFITCAVRLRHAGLDSALERFVRLLPIDHAGAYVNGLVLLDRDQPEQAADHFRNAGEAFSGDLRRTDTTLLPLLLPEDVFRAGAAGYFAHIMDLLSKRGHAQTSILFARMSLERLDTVDGKSHVDLRDAIWQTIFLRSLDLLRYDDAYDALFSGMSPATRRTCLERFVTVLSENQQVRRLCTYQFLDLQDELEASLRFKAGNGEAFERPNYSEVLFAYYISRKDYRSAAASMYRYAAKVHLAENEGRSAKRSQHLAEICQSLSSTIEALSMLAGDDAWFVAEPIGAAVPSKKRKLESENTMWYKGRETVSLDDVRNSFALASAKLLLGSQNPSYGTSTLALDAQNTVSLLVSRGLLDSAVAVSRSFDLSFEPVLGALVDQCVKVASLPRNDSFASLAFERIDCRLPSEGNLLERSWKVLKTYLDTIENLNSDGSMASRRFVVDRLLRYDQGASIPPWLVAPLKAGHYEDLVRLYVRHDRLTEAAQLIIEGIGKSLAADLSFLRLQPGKRWVPYSLIDQLLVAMESNGVGASDAAVRLNEIRTSLVNRVREGATRAAEDSEMLFT